jgi:hypothetical protein
MPCLSVRPGTYWLIWIGCDWLGAAVAGRRACMWTPENRPKYDRSKLRYPSRIPSFFCRYISMLATLNPEDDEARRCQGCHRAVTVALLEEYDWVEQVISS